MPLPTPKELKAALSAATKEAAERKSEADAAEVVYWAARRLASEASEKARTIETAAKVIGWPDKERGEFLGDTFAPNKAPNWAVL